MQFSDLGTQYRALQKEIDAGIHNTPNHIQFISESDEDIEKAINVFKEVLV